MSDLPPVGSIGLLAVRGWAGVAIRLGQWLDGDGTRNFEHAFVLTAVPSASRPAQIVEAEPGGCRSADLSEYSGRKVLWLACPPEYSEEVAAAAISYIGCPYSAEDYLAIAAQRLEIPGYKILRRAVDRSRHVICSQMADAAASTGGWVLFADSLWPGYVTPADLAGRVPESVSPQRID